MKICILTTSYPLGAHDKKSAAGFFVRDFALELNGQGHQVTVITQEVSGEVVNDDEAIEVIRFKHLARKPLSTLSLFNPLDVMGIISIAWNGYFTLKRRIEKERFDLNLALWAVPSGIWALLMKRKFNIPYFVWALGSDIWSYGRYPLLKNFVKMAIRGADHVYADGIVLKQDVTKLAQKDCEFLASSRNLKSQKLIEFNVGEKPYFIFVGRFHINKGVDVLIEALGLLHNSVFEKFHFHIIGDGPLWEGVQEQTKQLGLEQNITLHGFAEASKVAYFLKRAYCIIIPSRIESIPCVLSDAMQMGAPAIVTDVGDMGDLIGKYKAGLVVENENPEVMAKAIDEMIELGKDGFLPGIHSLKNEFDLSKSVRKIVERYESL